MRILIQDHGSAPELVVRRALTVLIESGIYSADGGGIFGHRAIVLVDSEHVPEAVKALHKAGMRAATG
jgi:hypothetical protein